MLANSICVNCKHWRGCKHNEWADCSMIVEELYPYIKQLVTMHGFPLHKPYDPADWKYLDDDTRHLLYNTLRNLKAKDGIRRQVVRKDDIRFIVSPDGEIKGERTARAKLIYFQTRKDNTCKKFEGVTHD